MAEDNEKEKNEQKDGGTKIEIHISSLLSPKLLRWAQKFLLVLGTLAFLTFILLVSWLVIRTNLDTRAIEFLSGLIRYSVLALIIIILLSAFVGFLNINIRSKAEQEEDLQRREVRKIDLELQDIDFHIDVIGADEEERQALTSKYNELIKERNLLVSRGSQVLERAVSTDWGITLVESRKRLLKEEERLETRNAANLAYGMFAAGLGGVILVCVAAFPYIFDSIDIPSFENLPVYYIPSTSFSIIIGIVAIFFLRLFAQTEKSIERNKNELTNIELRLTAGQLLNQSKDTFGSLADDLTKEERNFILKKNESSTVMNIDRADIDRAVEIATKIIKATK